MVLCAAKGEGALFCRFDSESNADFSKTQWGYKRREFHCGTCVERKAAFRDASVEIPAEYMA